MFTAYDVSKGLGSNTESEYTFALQKAKVLMELRHFVDKLESDEYILQTVECASVGSADDFAMSRLTLTFHERKLTEKLI